ncbi:MAG: tetratricopeptide repeat protein [Deltaproteobacteria bacterium]|nr:tetratricopeptide repeat protein [Deltaproteobacteria bacterium]
MKNPLSKPTEASAGPNPSAESIASATIGIRCVKGDSARAGSGIKPPTAKSPTGTDTNGDYRTLNERAHKALASGDLGKAETMFRAAMTQHPADVDSRFGLGQIARARGDHLGAMSYFKQTLEASPGFAPALLALADEQWQHGVKAQAIANYTLYLRGGSVGAEADRARARIAEGKKP